MAGPKIPGRLRDDLRRRDGSFCRYCARRVFPKHGQGCARPSHCLRRRTADHLVPEAQGGQTILSNLVVACQECNEAKGNQCAVGKWVPLPVPENPVIPQASAPCGCPPFVPRWERLGFKSWDDLMSESRRVAEAQAQNGYRRVLRTDDDSIASGG